MPHKLISILKPHSYSIKICTPLFNKGSSLVTSKCTVLRMVIKVWRVLDVWRERGKLFNREGAADTNALPPPVSFSLDFLKPYITRRTWTRTTFGLGCLVKWTMEQGYWVCDRLRGEYCRLWRKNMTKNIIDDMSVDFDVYTILREICYPKYPIY